MYRVTLFYTKASPFSNFFPCKFMIDGVEYTSSEQAFMAKKAQEFDDPEHLAMIRVAKTPFQAKQLGRKVRGFSEERWCAVREKHMYDVCKAKFSQNPALRAALLGTGLSSIAEASPKDRTWGIGLAATDPDAMDPKKWRGANLLGRVLERVRAELRAELDEPKARTPTRSAEEESRVKRARGGDRFD